MSFWYVRQYADFYEKIQTIILFIIQHIEPYFLKIFMIPQKHTSFKNFNCYNVPDSYASTKILHAVTFKQHI